MSFEITTAFVDQFRSQLFHLSQQMGSRLRDAVRQESQNGESAFYERLGITAAQKRTSRHADTPRVDVPHSRRRVDLEDYDIADLIDQEDRIRMLIDPASDYARSFIFALGRAMDTAIIEASRGNAFSGRNGGTNVAHPISQKLLSFELGTAGAITTKGLDVDALRRAKKLLDQNEVDSSIRRYCVLPAEQVQSLLEETEVTSSDFATVKALVQGEVNSFMGFDFIRTELTEQESAFFNDTATTGGAILSSVDGTITNADRVLCFATDGVLLAVGKDMAARIDERPDKNYATQVFASMSIGATRLEEEKVVDIVCRTPSSVIS